MNREEQFVELLTTHQRQLFGHIFAMVHSIADAEDVFQQTSLVIWERFDDFELGTDFVAWAGSIARYKAIDLLRAKGRDRLQFSPELLAQFAERQSDDSSRREARAQALEDCKLKLKQRDRTTLDTCYAPGTSIKQAAEKLGRPVGSVYDSLSRIRRRLLNCIEQALVEESTD